MPVTETTTFQVSIDFPSAMEESRRTVTEKAVEAALDKRFSISFLQMDRLSADSVRFDVFMNTDTHISFQDAIVEAASVLHHLATDGILMEAHSHRL